MIKLTDFIIKVSNMVNGYDKTAVLNWVAFADCMNESSDAGTSSLEEELFELYRSLCYVKNNFSDAVLQQSLKLNILGNEIIFGAMMFAAGYSYEEVRDLADEGVFEDGFIPYGTTEKSSLSVIGIRGRDDILFIERYQSAGSVRQRLNGAAVLADLRGQSIETMLKEAARTDRDTWMITHPKMINAVKTACTNSSAIEHITLYDPENHEIIQCNTERMTTEQRVAFFQNGSAGEQDWSKPSDPVLSM